MCFALACLGLTRPAQAQDVLVAPADGSDGASLTPSFQWEMYTGADNVDTDDYVLQISTTAGNYTGANLVYEKTGETCCDLPGDIAAFAGIPAGTLAPNTEYFWRILARDGAAVQYTYPEFSFTTWGVIFPVHTLTGVSIEPIFAWEAVNGASYYVLDLSELPNFGTIAFTQNTGAATSLALNYDTHGFKLANATDYYLRVKAYDAGNNLLTETSVQFRTTEAAKAILHYPADGLTVHQSNITFSWTINAAANGVAYHLQVKEASAGWGTLVVDEYPLTQRNFTANLPAGKSYSWRVISKDGNLANPPENGKVVSYSDVATFTIAGGALQPILSYPVGGLTVPTNKPQLSWYLGAAGVGLTFQVELVEAGGPWPGAPTYTTTNMYQPTDLLPGKTYQWRVRSYYAAGNAYSDWSDTETFTTNGAGTPIQPTLAYPNDNLTIYNTTPNMSWLIGSGVTGLSYNLYYDECATAACADGPTWVQVTTNNTYYPLPVTAGKTYRWYVESFSAAGGVSAPSAVWTFTVAGGVANGTPVLYYPIDDLEIYSLTPQLSWNIEGSRLQITGYETQLQYSTDGGANWNPTGAGTTINDPNHTYYNIPSGVLEWGTEYRWRVRSNGTAGTSSWTAWAYFETVGTTGSITPILSNPEVGAVVGGPDVLLQWYTNSAATGIDHFELQYSRTATYHPSYTVTVTKAVNETQHLAQDLMPGATYYWRVRTHNGSAWSNWSNPAGRFVVAAGSAPVVPRLGSPVADISIPVDAPVLSWALPTQSESALTYEVEYATNADMQDAMVISEIADPYAALGELPQGKYYWRVRSQNAEGEMSEFSEVGAFQVGTVATDVEDPAGELPGAYALEQNFPNPFNPSTTIRFVLPEAAQVRLTVYDALGREVRVLLDGPVAAGEQTATFDAANLPSGTYFYRLVTPQQTFTRSMVLMK